MQAHSGDSKSYHSNILELLCLSFGDIRKLENGAVVAVPKKYLKANWNENPQIYVSHRV